VYNYLPNLGLLRCPNDHTTVDEYNAAYQRAVDAGYISQFSPLDAGRFATHYSSYNVAVDKNHTPFMPALLYNYYGFYGPPNETREELRAVNIYTRAEAGRVYNGVSDDLGRALWSGYVDANNPGEPTASFPGVLNRQPPDSTILARCIQHRRNRFDLVVTVGGRTRKLPATYDWVRQPG
jgi:hypothetical protein